MRQFSGDADKNYVKGQTYTLQGKKYTYLGRNADGSKKFQEFKRDVDYHPPKPKKRTIAGKDRKLKKTYRR